MEAVGILEDYILHGANCGWQVINDTMVDGLRVMVWVIELPGKPQIGEWYRVEIGAKGNQISFYVDGNLLLQKNDDLHPSGGVVLFAYDAIVEFDNVVITGDDIPNVGPSGYAVEPEAKLSTTWGSIKR